MVIYIYIYINQFHKSGLDLKIYNIYTYYIYIYMLYLAITFLQLLSTINSIPIQDTHYNFVSNGDFYFYNTKNCTIRKCSGNSVDSPYGILTFPSRFYRDNYDIFGFDLLENEYIEMDITTPYKSVYYSFSLYLLDYIDVNGNIIKTSASLNDTLNNYYIESVLREEWFEKPLKLYISNNEIMTNYINRNIIGGRKNSFVLTFNYENYKPTKMRLSLFMRIILCNDYNKLLEYIDNPPIIAIRNKLNINIEPNYYNGVWKQRSIEGVNEYTVYYSIVNLYEEINDKFYLYIVDIMYSRPHLWNILYDNGWDCINSNIPCWIDNRDTLYLWSGCLDPTHNETKGVRGFYFDYSQIILVVGVNHTSYNNSIYHSSQLYDKTLEQSIYSFNNLNISGSNQSSNYENSCNILFNSTKYSNYYCVMYSREPREYWRDLIKENYSKFYIQITDELPYGIPTKHLAVIIERLYLQNKDTISVDMSKVIYPKVFSINKKLRCT